MHIFKALLHSEETHALIYTQQCFDPIFPKMGYYETSPMIGKQSNKCLRHLDSK